MSCWNAIRRRVSTAKVYCGTRLSCRDSHGSFSYAPGAVLDSLDFGLFWQCPRPHPNGACHSTNCWSCLKRALWCRAARKMSSNLGMSSIIPGSEYRASMKNCVSRGEPTQACSHQSSRCPRASAIAPEEGSRSLLLRLMLPRAGSRFQRSLLRQRAQGKQWSMCGEDVIRDADHTQVSANPPSRNCFARSSATLVS